MKNKLDQKCDENGSTYHVLQAEVGSGRLYVEHLLFAVFVEALQALVLSSLLALLST